MGRIVFSAEFYNVVDGELVRCVAPCCPGEIVDAENELRRYLVQSDWDCPGIAQTFGWDMRKLQVPGAAAPCEHEGTDGTVDCPCGVTASDFISAAWDYLRDEAADYGPVDDPGYLSPDC